MPALGPAVTAFVPLKAPDAAKQRLARALSAEARRQLVGFLLERVVQACLRACAVREVVVVAGDELAAALGRATGASVLAQHGAGLADALALADTYTSGDAASLIVMADLALISSADVDAVCAVGASRSPHVVVVPAQDGGTAVLYRDPPQVLATAFGPASAQAHTEAAHEVGVPVTQVVRQGLGLDVDTARDLARAAHADAELALWLQRHAPELGSWPDEPAS